MQVGQIQTAPAGIPGMLWSACRLCQGDLCERTPSAEEQTVNASRQVPGRQRAAQELPRTPWEGKREKRTPLARPRACCAQARAAATCHAVHCIACLHDVTGAPCSSGCSAGTPAAAPPAAVLPPAIQAASQLGTSQAKPPCMAASREASHAAEASRHQGAWRLHASKV